MALGFSNYLEPKLLDHILRATAFTTPATPFLALHDDQPGEAGANEVTGGSYARVALVMNAASGNSITNNGNHDFASMPAVTVTHISVWDAASTGNLLMYGPLGGTANTFTGAATGDVCTSYGHGLSNNDRIELTAFPGSALPGGYSETVLYHVISVTTDTFQLSLTQGGGAVTISSNGEGIAYTVVPKAVLVNDTFRVADTDLTVSID